MKIIGLTDIHGHLSLSANTKEEIQNAGLIVLTGDITHFGRRKEAESIIVQLIKLNKNILAVRGNCDFPEVEGYLNDKNINLHNQVKEINDIQFVGLGGSLPCPGTTPYEFTEEEYHVFLNGLAKMLKKEKPFILISHQPPYNTKADAVSDDFHAGSSEIRKFIEDRNPLACLCGHIHEGTGTDKIKDTLVVNPGPNRNGHYSVIEIQEGKLTGVKII